MKYKNLIKKSQEQLSLEQQQFQVEDNEAQLKEDLRVTNRAITLEERILVSLKSEAKLSATDILNSMDKLAGLKEGATTLEALMKELF